MSEKQIAQSGFAAFVPRARLLRLIGSELISDDIVAITELVKNAHDADASFISLQFINVTGGEGEIVIRDDGTGMDRDTLLTRWMQPAGSSKGRDSTRFTPLGRRMLGEKGVGRFAVDKLGARLEMVSRRVNESMEVHAVFDWDEFDADELMLSDVKSRWEVRPADWLDSHGTMLRITRLRAPWNERMFRRLCTRLARLVSPFQAQTGFRITIESDEFPSYAGDVSSGYLGEAPYKMETEFDGIDVMTVRLNGGKVVRHTLGSENQLRCGPVRIRLFAFDLETESLARIGPRAEVRAWLREWTGISVYRDGFRVWPYGEPSDDWLRLDQRRVNNPVVRLSNNQIVGFIEIGADKNPELRDQTNREGLIHNEAHADLQAFVLQALQLLEAQRQTQRHPQSRAAGSLPPKRATSALTDQLGNLAKRTTGPMAVELERMAAHARSSASADQVQRRRMLEGFTEMAAIGQSATLACHTLTACLDEVKDIGTALRRSYDKRDVEQIFQSAARLMNLESTVAQASEHLRTITSLTATVGKRRRGLDLSTELRRIQRTCTPLLESKNAELSVDAPKNVVLRTEMRPELFDAVVSALFLNSLEWRQKKQPLKMTTTVRVTGDAVELVFGDNGRGITPGLESKIFEPLVSGREDGAGMGLTVARNIVEMHGGSIEVVQDRRRRGATFLVRLPRKKSRATVPARP